ncbi:MAG TPA: hypothetical protein VGP93_18320, partial [Polyangiaceae bacterium]|nr:hypothetical protein [Polyangiaceae bacterium]
MAQAVKPTKPAREPAQQRRGLGRHLEGWQAGAVALWIAYVSAGLAVPRPTAPSDLPAPESDRRNLALELDEQQELARLARQRPLPFEVRAVGELLRRYGKASVAVHGDTADALLSDLRSASKDALSHHRERELLALRAVQSELFLSALESWEEKPTSSAELDELGGNLLQKARASGWVEQGRLLMSKPERVVFFSIRWSELTGLRARAPFAATLDDWRVYYGFLLEHPENAEGSPLEQAQRQLRYVDALAKRDAAYPAWFARGVLQYRSGAFAEAAEAFRAHLEQPASGYSLRARNHLLAALAKAQGT